MLLNLTLLAAYKVRNSFGDDSAKYERVFLKCRKAQCTANTQCSNVKNVLRGINVIGCIRNSFVVVVTLLINLTLFPYFNISYDALLLDINQREFSFFFWKRRLSSSAGQEQVH